MISEFRDFLFLLAPRCSCRGSGTIDFILTSICEVEGETSFASGATATVQLLPKGAKVTSEGEQQSPLIMSGLRGSIPVTRKDFPAS
ncbi:hypothetical protein AVEN_112497-1 [Araneus ventricosus]|uniref:Uncharacterized protein n=1 Tax=Araneus ventricosus TaxID=182803 RepID=A0A4Y2LVV0_ARAVE|nr:hypothetical protein AVEN_112497-1 [Araneus ventricosus]